MQLDLEEEPLAQATWPWTGIESKGTKENRSNLENKKPRWRIYNFGHTKIKIEIDLHGTLPAEVEVRDYSGFSDRVKVEYPSLPPKCCNCGRFGHYLNRYLMPPQKRKHSDKPNHSMISSKVAMVESKIPLSVDKSKLEEPIAAPEVICASDLSAPRKKSRSRSRGRKNAANKGSRVTNSSQNHVPEKHWVPVETQQIPPLVASEVQPEVRYSDQVEEEAESCPRHQL